MRDPQGEPSDLIRSVSRALRVLEAVGHTPRGLTVKQIARRCDLTVATTYHLVRTLAYEGYVIRREDGTYVVGMEIADRFREFVAAFRGPDGVVDVLRRAAAETGYSHFLGRFVSGKVTITVVAEGSRSPYVEDLLPGFDDAAHATALGKALLATLSPDQRMRYLKDWGMRAFTPSTLITLEALEADLVTADRRGVHTEVGQYRPGVGCAALVIVNDRDPDRRLALGCSMSLPDLVAPHTLRAALIDTGQAVVEALAGTMDYPGPATI